MPLSEFYTDDASDENNDRSDYDEHDKENFIVMFGVSERYYINVFDCLEMEKFIVNNVTGMGMNTSMEKLTKTISISSYSFEKPL